MVLLIALSALSADLSSGLAGSIYGVIKDGCTKLPLDKAEVLIDIGYGTLKVKGLPNGFYSSFVPEGTNYRIEVRRNGYKPGFARGVDVRANDYTEVNVALMPADWSWPMKRVSLRAANDKYVCADLDKGAGLAADRERREAWETFDLYQIDKNRVALRAANGKFVCADRDQDGRLKADRDCPGEWEQFFLQDLGGKRVALRAVSNRRFVCADLAQNGRLIANRLEAKEWETFVLEE